MNVKNEMCDTQKQIHSNYIEIFDKNILFIYPTSTNKTKNEFDGRGKNKHGMLVDRNVHKTINKIQIERTTEMNRREREKKKKH